MPQAALSATNDSLPRGEGVSEANVELASERTSLVNSSPRTAVNPEAQE